MNKSGAALLGLAALSACAPDRPLPTEKGFTIPARAERGYGVCQVRIAGKAYGVIDDLQALRNDMRARFGARMHQWSTEVRVQSLGVSSAGCGAEAIVALHKAGFVRFILADAATPVTKR